MKQELSRTEIHRSWPFHFEKENEVGGEEVMFGIVFFEMTKTKTTYTEKEND